MIANACVVSIHIAPSGAAPMQAVTAIKALVGKGLEGDRYFSGVGTYSSNPGSGRDVTLIEFEALEGLEREYNITLEAGLFRRNIITRGVALNHLVGKKFRVGDTVLQGTRLCEPCLHLEKLTAKGVLRGLIHRGGLRAEVVKGGMIRVGDEIALCR